MHLVIHDYFQVDPILKVFQISIEDPLNLFKGLGVFCIQKVLLHVFQNVDGLHWLQPKDAQLEYGDSHQALYLLFEAEVLERLDHLNRLFENEVLAIAGGGHWLPVLLNNIFEVDSVLQDSVCVVNIILTHRCVNTDD
jgi:hypothetical protein